MALDDVQAVKLFWEHGILALIAGSNNCDDRAKYGSSLFHIFLCDWVIRSRNHIDCQRCNKYAFWLDLLFSFIHSSITTGLLLVFHIVKRPWSL